MAKNKVPSSRQSAIQRKILLEGSVSVETLVNEFNVSLATIRRDLTFLEEQGLARRTHGGAMNLSQHGADQEFAQREQVDNEGKSLIASAAMELVTADQTLFMNDGSTVLALARELVASDLPLTVVTPGVNIATALSENTNTNAYLTGGLVRHRTLGTTGDFVEQMLRFFNADTAFIAAEGFTVRDGLTYSYEADAKIARIMQSKAELTVILATERKLDQRDRITAIPASDVNVLITDCQDENKLNSFKEAGIETIIARPLHLKIVNH
jgi:DeoR/GlpR family transcriptional regulator of sugar metabolism